MINNWRSLYKTPTVLFLVATYSAVLYSKKENKHPWEQLPAILQLDWDVMWRWMHNEAEWHNEPHTSTPTTKWEWCRSKRATWPPGGALAAESNTWNNMQHKIPKSYYAPQMCRNAGVLARRWQVRVGSGSCATVWRFSGDASSTESRLRLRPPFLSTAANLAGRTLPQKGAEDVSCEHQQEVVWTRLPFQAFYFTIPYLILHQVKDCFWVFCLTEQAHGFE